MKRLRIHVALLHLLTFASAIHPVAAQPADSTQNHTILILGSSVAAGWVTSYQEKYDMQNGYAARLGRLLEPRGWTVKNISIPGFDTRATIDRFEEEVIPLHPRVVFIGLSMANEGLTAENPDSVFLRYRDGISHLATLCRQHNMIPDRWEGFCCQESRHPGRS